MNIHIRTSADGDWIAVYRDGVMVEQGHSCSLQCGLIALGIPFTELEVELDDIGNMPDGSEPFPERLPCWRVGGEAGCASIAPEPVYEWRAVFPNSDGSYRVQPLAKEPRPGTRMLVEGHNRGWVERRNAVAWERYDEANDDT